MRSTSLFALTCLVICALTMGCYSEQADTSRQPVHESQPVSKAKVSPKESKPIQAESAHPAQTMPVRWDLVARSNIDDGTPLVNTGKVIPHTDVNGQRCWVPLYTTEGMERRRQAALVSNRLRTGSSLLRNRFR